MPHHMMSSGTGRSASDGHLHLGKNRRVRDFRIAAWNVRSLFKPGKLENVELEAERLKIDVLGISEVR